MSMRWIAVCALAATLPLYAQARPGGQARGKTPPPKAAAAQSWPLQAIAIKGLRSFDVKQVINATGLKTEQRVAPKDLDAARDRLLATGAFESVAYEYRPARNNTAIEVTFEVREADELFPYRFEGLNLDEAKLRSHLRQAEPLFGERIPANQPVIERFVRAIEAFAGSAGKIAGRVETLSGANDLAIVFRPASLPSVAEVKFTGNTIYDERTLQQAIASAAVGALYTEPRFHQVLDSNIRPLYEAKGRLRVKFPKLVTEQAKNVNGLTVTVHVEEGPEYKLDEVFVKGAGKELLKEGKFRTEEVVNFTLFKEGVARMEQAMKRGGFMRVRSSVERNIDDKAKLLDVTIVIDPGPQYTFGKLTIEGLDIQTEPHIRKLWTLKSGGPFNADYPEYFLSRIREDGVLDRLGETKSTIQLDETKRIADVTLIFKGEKRVEKPSPGF